MKRIGLYLLALILFTASGAYGTEPLTAEVGVMVVSRPDYEGSDDSDFDFLPYLDIRFLDLFFLNHRRGLGVNLLRGDHFILGGSFGYYEDRDEDDSPALKGLGDVDNGIDGRLFATVLWEEFRVSFEIRTDLSGTHDGNLYILEGRYVVEEEDEMKLRLGPRFTFADDDYMSTYFGINLLQSARSGLRFFRAEGGLKDLGVDATLVQKLGGHWNWVATLGFKRLVGDAADSPIVDPVGSPNQFQIGVGLTYDF